MSSFVSFIQKQSCRFIITLFILSSCSHFSNRTANNKNEIQRNLAQASGLSGELDKPNTSEQILANQLVDSLLERSTLISTDVDILFNLFKTSMEETRIGMEGRSVNLPAHVLYDALGKNLDTIYNSRGNNLLHFAAANPETFWGESLDDLIDRSNINHRNRSGDTALDIARMNRGKAKEPHHQVVEVYAEAMERHYDPQQHLDQLVGRLEKNSPKYYTTKPTQVDAMFRAIERGARINLYAFIDLFGSQINTIRGSKGNTLLHLAIANPQRFGRPGLFATLQGKGTPISYLIRKGADPSIKNEVGNTAIDIAEIRRGLDSSVFQELVDVGREISSHQRDFNIILEKVRMGVDVTGSQMDVFLNALRNGAKLSPYQISEAFFAFANRNGFHIRDSKGNTLLHFAVSEEAVARDGNRLFSGRSLDFLIQGSDLTFRNRRGETALDVAESNRKNIPQYDLQELVEATTEARDRENYKKDWSPAKNTRQKDKQIDCYY